MYDSVSWKLIEHKDMNSRIERVKRLIIIQLKYLWNTIIHRNRYNDDGVTCVIFSKDRAMQLDALLESIIMYAEASFPIIVQYSASEIHKSSYETIIKKYKNVVFVKETSVRKTLIEIIQSVKTQYMFFLVDDQVFIRPFNVNLLLKKLGKGIFASMRLGDNITNFGIRDVPLYPKYKKDGFFLNWKWKKNKRQYDWGYQFSVDGTIYRTIDVFRCTLSIPFGAPNSYESNMNSVLLFKKNNSGISFLKPVVTNLIINASRQENGYEQCESGNYSTIDMLHLLEKGNSFDIIKISSINYTSTHHIIVDINTILK